MGILGIGVIELAFILFVFVIPLLLSARFPTIRPIAGVLLLLLGLVLTLRGSTAIIGIPVALVGFLLIWVGAKRILGRPPAK